MNFVDEKYRALGCIAQIGKQIFGGCERRPTGNLQRHSKLFRNTGGKRCLPEAWGAVEQDVTEHLPSLASCIYSNHEPLKNSPLADHIGHPLWPKRAILNGSFFCWLNRWLSKTRHELFLLTRMREREVYRLYPNTMV